MADLIRIPANDVQLDGLDIEVGLTFAWLEQALCEGGVRARRDVEDLGRVSGRLSRSGNDIVVRCRVVAAVELGCVRCLEPTGIDVETELSLLLQPISRRKARTATVGQDQEYELGPDDADTDVYDGDTVVLDRFVREAILLEIPNFPLCSEVCPGIRPGPEQTLGGGIESSAIDPRLAPLGAFRKGASQKNSATDGSDAGPVTIETLVAAAAERSAVLGRKPILRSDTRRGVSKRKKKK